MALSIFEDCVTLPGRGSLVAATAAAIAVLLPATASCREDADGGIGSGPCAIGDPESDELQADRTKGRAIAAANDAAPVRRMNMARPPCFDGAARSLARLPMRVAPGKQAKTLKSLMPIPGTRINDLRRRVVSRFEIFEVSSSVPTGMPWRRRPAPLVRTVPRMTSRRPASSCPDALRRLLPLAKARPTHTPPPCQGGGREGGRQDAHARH